MIATSWKFKFLKRSFEISLIVFLLEISCVVSDFFSSWLTHALHLCAKGRFDLISCIEESRGESGNRGDPYPFKSKCKSIGGK